jgi:hypothetical protein
MRSPGFSGELALYRTGHRYRTTWPGHPAIGLALQARATWSGRPGPGRPDCIPGCICVTPEGCPCCDVVPDRMLAAARDTHVALTCQPGQDSMCQDWCDHQGGGMSSNPDGSTTCTVYNVSR